MNLQTLLDKQRELDAHILEKHPVGAGDDRLAKKVLAFQTELGECANEWRGFKFWSDDQKPRIEETKQCETCEGTGKRKVANEKTKWKLETVDCFVCRGKGAVITQQGTLLEEYVDCLHFLLSIGLEIGVQEIEVAQNLSAPKVYANKPTVQRFIGLNAGALALLNRTTRTLSDSYLSMFEGFIKLAYQLGFTWEQVETAYFEKNAVNHQRQETGY